MFMPSNHLNPSDHVTREEIRLTIHLHVMTLYRHYFLHQELEKMRLDSIRTSDSNGDLLGGLVYDRIRISESINAKLQSHRSLIRKYAHYIDDMLYKHAGTIEDYSNLDDLEERANEVLAGLSFEGRDRY